MAAQTNFTPSSIKITHIFTLHWKDGRVEEVEGTDIIDALASKGHEPIVLAQLKKWSHTNAVGLGIRELNSLADISDEELLEIDLDDFKEVDFNDVNGILDESCELSVAIAHCNCISPLDKLLQMGFNEKLRAVLISGKKCESYTHKFINGLIDLGIPIMFDHSIEKKSLPLKAKIRLISCTSMDDE